MRVDIYSKYNNAPRWRCYCEAVTLSNAKRIAETLESQGEYVALFNHTKCLGKMIYETADKVTP